MRVQSSLPAPCTAFLVFFLVSTTLCLAVPGDTCGDPFVISSLPETVSGNTCGFAHDTGGYCTQDDGAPDVVYVFVPDHHMEVNISLCGGAVWDTVLYVFKDSCLGTPIACNDDYCGVQSKIESLLLKADTTYYIVVDGFGVSCGDYTLSVTKLLPPGDGITTPYQLSMPQQLIAIGTDPDLMDKWFILVNDIDMQGYVFNKALIAPDMDPVTDGFQGTAFSGIFDGDGFKISNLTINTGGQPSDNLGLFGFIDGGQIQNLTIEAVNSTGADGSNGVGAVAGDNRGNIINCSSTGTVQVGNSLYDVGGLVGLNYGNIRDCTSACTVTAGQTDAENIGGLAGSNYDAGEILNCQATGQVIGEIKVGGLVGYNRAAVSNCKTSGTVSGTDDVGGLVGYQYYNSLASCYSICDVNGANNVGGLVGNNDGGNITDCRTAGTVSGSYYVGGLLGCNGSWSLVSGCCSTASVSGTYCVGGLIGLHSFSTAANCYALGDVSGGSSVGGLVGLNWHDGEISNCYAAGTANGTSEVGGLAGSFITMPGQGGIFNSYFLAPPGPDNGLGIPLTDTQMRQQSSFVDWDFVGEYNTGAQDFWQMPCGGGYPRLRFEFVATFGGQGTDDEPYQISSADQLVSIGADADLLDKHYILTNDIDLSGCTFTNALVAPDTDNSYITFDGTPFTGNLEGNDHDITALVINGGNNTHIGLFGKVGSESIESFVNNIGILNCDVSGYDYVGGLVGENDGGDIYNCYATGTVTGVFDIGGLIGWSSNGTISACHATVSASQAAYMGGLIGWSLNNVVTNCYSTGDVAGAYHLGGLIGYNSASTISNSYYIGSVSGDQQVGGLLGFNHQSIVSNCYSIGTVNGITYYAGGLIGADQLSTIFNCYASGAVNGAYSGGLVGGAEESDVYNCYSTGLVSGSEVAGGLVGSNYSVSSIDNSYFLDTGGPANGFGMPLTDAQMKQQSSFVDWDFTTPVWMMLRRGEDYPRLAWQTIYPGDIAGLYGVDNVDFAEISRNWLQSGCPSRCEDADIDASGHVDMADLILFVEDWIKSY